MTDNDIIRALECCASSNYPEDCADCFYIECTSKEGCVVEMMQDVLDLINRQQAEIERLNGELIVELVRRKNAVDAYHEARTEIERLEAEVDKQYEQAKADILGNMADGGTSCHWCIAQHEANARKEFAKRLKAESVFLEDEDRYVGYAVKMTDLDNLSKEMEKEGD